MKKTLFLLILFCTLMAFSQKAYVTENDKYCIWQPDVKLSFEMFENTKPDSAAVKIMNKECRQLMPFLGFWHVVDIPKKGKGKGKLDKGYICAAFSKFHSCIIARDSFDLMCAQLLWDAMEIGTRMSRIQLDSLQTEAGLPIDNFYSMYLMTAVGIGKEFYSNVLYRVIQDVQIPRDEKKYLEYRRMFDNFLKSTAKFASSKEEATRLLAGKTIEPYLKEAVNIVGDLRK